jgi:ABC-2 type transport system permease protein
MKKFLILLQKEIRELLTPQMLIPFLLVIVIFYFFGNYATKEATKNQGPQKIVILDKDNSNLSKSIISSISKSNFETEVYSNNDQDPINLMKNTKTIIGLTIPEGFQNSVENLNPEKIKTYSLLQSLTFTEISKYANLDKAAAVANEVIINKYLSDKVPNINPALIKNPVQANTYTYANGNIAEISATALLSYISSRTYIVPIILFIVIVLASQMIATSVASEKENKTLETILTAPINRKTLVIAKMVGAGIVSLVLAGIYIFGFRSYLSGVSGGAIGGPSANIQPSLDSLGLVLTPTSYLLLGLVVFIGILVALSIAMILGAFAEDVKSVQSVIAPLMVFVLIPYFATLFLDINALPNIARYVIYAIPFSHVFLAMPNLYLHNDLYVVYGIIYELFVFIIFVWIAAWIFSTDKIITMRLNFSKKKKN